MKILTALLAIILVLAAFTYDLNLSVALQKEGVINVKDMQELSLELVYEGTKPEGIGSVQGFAITDKYFVIASRPPGSADDGGETDNRLIIIDKSSKKDVTNKFPRARKTYELGHANGMTYDAARNELVVVGIHDQNGDYTGAVRLDADTFELKGILALENVAASGIASDGSGSFWVRVKGAIRKLDQDLKLQDGTGFDYDSGLVAQDIACHDGVLYLADWAKRSCFEGRNLTGLEPNQNAVYRLDSRTGKVTAFVVKSPRDELEGIDFSGDDAYVLYNGIGLHKNKFYLYKVRDSILKST